MWQILQARPAPVVTNSVADDGHQEFTAQVRNEWDSDENPETREDWRHRPGGEDWPAIDALPGAGQQTAAYAPSGGGQPMQDLLPPEVRAQPAARRIFPRFRVKGDAARRDTVEPRRGFQGVMPDWSSDSGTQERQLRGLVTNVRPPNPSGVNPDWAGVMTDPLAQYPRNPAIGDWWI